MADTNALVRALVNATAAQQDSTRKMQELQQADILVQQETNRQYKMLLQEAREEPGAQKCKNPYPGPE